MNTTQQDPISDFFTSEWTKGHLLSPDFSATVLKKITVNRHHEWLIDLACIVVAIVGIVAVLLFIYPEMFTSLSNTTLKFGSTLKEAFSIQINQPENPFLLGLFIYLHLLAVTLWGVDYFLRKKSRRNVLQL